MNKNKFLLLPPKTVHTIIHQSEDFSKFIWGFNINDNFVNMEFLKKYSPILFYDTSADISKAVLSILENIEKNEFEFYSIIKFQLYYIFVLLARQTNISSNPEIYNKTYDNEIKMIKKIYDNLSFHVTIDKVASAFFMSRDKIEKICKSECNQTFAQIKREIQVNVITNFLISDDCSIEKISEITGFCDRYSLEKFFKKM